MQNLFSYPLMLDEMGNGTKTYQLIADAKQLKYIEEILKLDTINSFEAKISVCLNRKNHCLNISGFVDANVEHTSVISLEKFTRNYHPEFEIVYDTELTYEQLKEIEFDFDDDEPEIIENGQVDLADIAMEQLALALDDFPRKDGEIFEFKSEFDEETTTKANPFAALAKLKK